MTDWNWIIGIKGGGIIPFPEAYAYILNFVFTVIRVFVSGLAVLVDAALSWTLPQMLKDLTAGVALRLEDALGWGTLLRGSVVFTITAIAGVVIYHRYLRGRKSQALTEGVISLFVIVLYVGWVTVSPGGVNAAADTLLGSAKTFGTSASLVILDIDPDSVPEKCRQVELSAPDEGEPPPEAPPVDAGCVMGEAMKRALLLPIYDFMQWGEPLGDPDDPNNELQACATIRTEVLSDGSAADNSDEPRKRMREAGEECERFAEINTEPRMERLTAGVASGLGVLAALFTPIVVGLTTIYATLRVFGRMAALPLFVGYGIMPGEPRAAMWRYVANTIDAAIQLAIAIIALAVYLMMISAWQATAGSFTTGLVGVDMVTTLIHFLLGLVVLFIFGLFVFVGWWRAAKSMKTHFRSTVERFSNVEGSSGEVYTTEERTPHRRRRRIRDTAGETVKSGLRHRAREMASSVVSNAATTKAIKSTAKFR